MKKIKIKSAQEDVVALADRPEGMSLDDLVSHRGSKTKGPMQRAINKALKLGKIVPNRKNDDGQTVYVTRDVAPSTAPIRSTVAEKKQRRLPSSNGNGRLPAATPRPRELTANLLDAIADLIRHG